MTLAHDPRVREVLGGLSPFHTVEHHDLVGSTNDVALERLRAGTPPGIVVVADRQSAGRGRRGRPWTDDVVGRTGPANLAVTATLSAPGRGVGLVPLAVGLAVLDGYATQGAVGQLKWPNDVLLDDRKAAGILVEHHTVAGGAVLLLGAGLDLDWRGVDRGGDAAGWTSVAEEVDGDVDRGEVLAGLLAGMGRWIHLAGHDPRGFVAAYRRVCRTLGQQVRVELPGGATVSGRAARIDAEGHLHVGSGGAPTVVRVGDVRHVRPA